MSPQGNPILVYDVERTICDIVKNKKRIEQQVYVQGLQNYFLKGKPNLRKLSKISKEALTPFLLDEPLIDFNPRHLIPLETISPSFEALIKT